jgi:hypothetical protein
VNDFKPGDAVFAGPTRATFVKYVGAAYGPAQSQAVIQVGMDTRVVDPVSLRKAS